MLFFMAFFRRRPFLVTKVRRRFLRWPFFRYTKNKRWKMNSIENQHKKINLGKVKNRAKKNVQTF